MLARGCSLLLALVLVLLPLAAHSGVNCQKLYGRGFIKTTYYVIGFLGRERLPDDPQERSAKLGELEERISPRLQDYVNKLSAKLDGTPPLVIFLTCDTPVQVDDLDRTEVETLMRRNVISALWASNDGGTAAMTQLSLPHFLRRPQAQRRQIEIAWKMVSLAAIRSVDDWLVELDRDSIAQQALLAMNVGFMALKAAQLPLAKLSLCQVRRNLKLMSEEIVRPSAQELQSSVSLLVGDLIAEVDSEASGKGINLSANESVRLACAGH